MGHFFSSFARRGILTLAICSLLQACSHPPESGMEAGMFTPCPSSPNCISSDARDSRHAIAPFVLRASGPDIWPQIRAAVLILPRTKLVADDANYLHAECRSAVVGFIDDLEIQLRAGEHRLAVRSASRKGYYDFGVNRRRLESLRGLLRERGLVQ
ncbi:MAG: DUF1499 domain-containing protein [Chthoniobacterales bacterium]